MMRPNHAFHFQCEQCGWSDITHPKSDAIILGSEYHTCCPKCGSENLQVTSVKLGIDYTLALAKQRIKDLFGRS